jgi:hypothetical protein
VAEWVREAIMTIDGVAEAESRFKDDLAYWVDGTEIAHLESDRELDVRLTRRMIREHRADLRADPRIRLRPNSSDWITVLAEGPDARDLVIRVVGWAAAAHRPGARRA